MNKIEKLLNKLSDKEKIVIKKIVGQIISGDTDGLDVKKLVGNQDIFRIKKGKIRIIFVKKNQGASIISIQRRSEKTYKDF